MTPNIDPDVETTPTRELPYRWQRTVDSLARTGYAVLTGGRTPRPEQWNAGLTLLLALVIVAAVSTALLAFFLVLSFLGFAARTIGADIWNEAAAQAVVQPIRAYLQAHATGVPLSADNIWYVYGVWGAVSLLWAAATRNPGARIAWVLFGVASVAMVYVQTRNTVLAGIAGLWWMAGSLLALRGRWSTPQVIAHIPGLAFRRNGNLATLNGIQKQARRARTATNTALAVDDDGAWTPPKPFRPVTATYNTARWPILDMLGKAGSYGMAADEIYAELADRGFALQRTTLYIWLDRYCLDPSVGIQIAADATGRRYVLAHHDAASTGADNNGTTPL